MKKLCLLLLLALGLSVPSYAQRATGSLTAASSDCTTAASCLTTYVTNNDGGATFAISGTFSATVQFEATANGGTTWVALSVTPSNSTTAVTSATAAGTWQANVSGYTNVRIRVSTFTSGTVVTSIGVGIASARGGSGGGGGGGSGTVSGQANGVIPLGTTATTITQQSHLDDGVTTAGTITSSEPLVVTSDGVHNAALSLICNTTNAALPTNTFSWLGCTSASNTAWGITMPQNENGSAGVFHVGAASSHYSAATISAIVSADLNITTTTCSNQFVTAISATGTGTCTTDTLASAQHANQGTTTTVLHGNGAGNPAFGAVVGADMTSNTVTATQLAAQYSKWESCGSRGLGDGLNAITAGTYLQFACVNDTGVTVTLTGIRCWTDNAGSSTLNAANNAATALLTGAVTCNATKASGGAAGTQSGTTTLANGDAISFTFVADGTSKQANWTVSGTY